jgi:hypothetical protein
MLTDTDPDQSRTVKVVVVVDQRANHTPYQLDITERLHDSSATYEVPVYPLSAYAGDSLNPELH